MIDTEFDRIACLERVFEQGTIRKAGDLQVRVRVRVRVRATGSGI
jgi:hypothetical protein